jgi:hypothetical protein
MPIRAMLTGKGVLHGKKWPTSLRTRALNAKFKMRLRKFVFFVGSLT